MYNKYLKQEHHGRKSKLERRDRRRRLLELLGGAHELKRRADKRAQLEPTLLTIILLSSCESKKVLYMMSISMRALQIMSILRGSIVQHPRCDHRHLCHAQ